jgi:hypothetical protein
MAWGGAVLIFFFGCVYGCESKSGDWLVPTLLGLVGGVAFRVIYPVLFRVFHEHGLRKFYSQGSTRGITGMRECELCADGVIVRSETGELKTRWEGLDRIVTTDDYTFIVLSSVSTHVIPRRGVVEGDYGSFVRALMDRFQEVRGTPQN